MRNIFVLLSSVLSFCICDDSIDLSNYEKISENFVCGVNDTNLATYSIVNDSSKILIKHIERLSNCMYCLSRHENT